MPQEPPAIWILTEPTALRMDKHEATLSHGTTNVIPNDAPDNDSLETYEYTAILPKYQCMHSSIPETVRVHSDTTNDTTVSTDTQSATPFLMAGSDKRLPKHSAKSKDDINKFIYKL